MTEKYIPNQIRHGDILLNPIKKIPANVKPKDQMLAAGELTGHHHETFQCQVLGNVDQVTKGAPLNEMEQYVIVDQTGAILDHQEHGQVPLNVDQYEVIHQRQYNTYREEIQRVQD